MAKQDSVTSSDGTTIVFDRAGDGPPVVIIGAGPTDRSENAPVADLLSAHFTVYNYDRRARGDSGDTAPFSVGREYDDLAAVIDSAGGSAFLYGTSGGAVIALEAVGRGLGAAKLALWEPPYVLDDEPSRPRPPADYEDRVAAAVAAGRPGDAVELFFSAAVGMPARRPRAGARRVLRLLNDRQSRSGIPIERGHVLAPISAHRLRRCG
jgi:alpha-beta hydrolase superfamily lysophospholipase